MDNILKNRINQINIFLFIILLIIISNLKFEKIDRSLNSFNWDFILYSNFSIVKKEKNLDNSILKVQILDVVLENTDDNGSILVLDLFKKKTIIKNDGTFCADNERVHEKFYPNAIEVQYFSYDEHQKYYLDDDIPFEKVVKTAVNIREDLNSNLTFIINILSKGRVALYLCNTKTNKIALIQVFEASKVSLSSREIRELKNLK
jgi:hypothetical protein